MSENIDEILVKQLKWLLKDSEPLSRETILCCLLDFLNAHLRRTGEPEVPAPQHLEVEV